MAASLSRNLFTASVHKVSFSAIPTPGVKLLGEVVDLVEADTYTHVLVMGGPNSGQAHLQIQTSDSPASGSFTDPTSGAPDYVWPGELMSGGIMIVNSGFLQSGRVFGTAPVSGLTRFASGGVQGASFPRPHRYARAISLSGSFTELLTVGFIGGLRTVGSGGGFG